MTLTPAEAEALQTLREIKRDKDRAVGLILERGDDLLRYVYHSDDLPQIEPKPFSQTTNPKQRHEKTPEH